MIRDMFTGEMREAAGTPPEEIELDEFVARFKAKLLSLTRFTSQQFYVEQYGDVTAEEYFTDIDTRRDGPEACAEADFDCWESA